MTGKEVKKAFSSVAADMRAVADWIDNQNDMMTDRGMALAYGADDVLKVRRRLGLVKWALGMTTKGVKHHTP